MFHAVTLIFYSNYCFPVLSFFHIIVLFTLHLQKLISVMLYKFIKGFKHNPLTNIVSIVIVFKLSKKIKNKNAMDQFVFNVSLFFLI